MFISVKDADKTQLAVSVAHQLHKLGFSLISTAGTAAFLKANGIPAEVVQARERGRHRPPGPDPRRAGSSSSSTRPSGKGPRTDEISIRAMANSRGIPVVTTMPGADAYVQGIRALIRGELGVTPIQRYHAGERTARASASRPSTG